MVHATKTILNLDDKSILWVKYLFIMSKRIHFIITFCEIRISISIVNKCKEIANQIVCGRDLWYLIIIMITLSN